MAQKSSIKTLPDDVRERLNFLIAEDQLTIDALTAWLDAEGYARSRSAVHRHAAKIKKATENLRQSREITQAMISELGDSAMQGEQGRVLVEMARSMVFDFMLKMQEGAEEENAGPALDAKDIAMLGKGLAEMGRAMRLDQDFETKVREQADKAARIAAAENAKAVASEAGLSEEAVAEIQKRIMGL